MTDKQPTQTAVAAATPEPMPAEGGSYTRLPDGSLQPSAAPEATTDKD